MVPHSRTITTALYYARSSNQKIAQDSQEKVNQGKKFVVEAQNALVEAQRALVETQQALAESKGQLDDIENSYEALAPWNPRRYFKLKDARDAKQDIRDAENRVQHTKQDIRDAETDLKGFERQVERCIEWTDDDTCRKATDFLMNREIFDQKRRRFKTIRIVVTCDVVERFEDIVDGAGYKGSD